MQCKSWLAYYVQRHFLRVGEPQNQRRIYLSAAFWDPWGTEPLKQPLCIATMFEKAKHQGNEFYTSALMQMWSLTQAPADGIPHLLGEDLSHLLPDYQASVRGCIQGPRLLSVAVPLLEIEDTEALDSRVLRPLILASTRLTEALKQAQESAAPAQIVSSVSELDLAQLQRENTEPEHAPVESGGACAPRATALPGGS